MAVKKVEFAEVGTVSLYKRRGAKNVRLSISHTGEVRVTIPLWAPYKVGLDFLQTRLEWIQLQRPSSNLLEQGRQIGKAHHIEFQTGASSTVTTRIVGNEARVILPVGTNPESSAAQAAAQKAGIRALKLQANKLLPGRLQLLAQQHGYTYKSVAIKQLKSRWGSCSQHKDIVLSCFLMQLPWDLIDYVLLHELAHTKVMAHGPAFWSEMTQTLPDVQRYRKLIKTHKPIL
jgi:predicted metal-dependent hydrolase